MNPIDMVFQAFSGLTGGLVTDMYTAIIAMIGITILYHGGKMLINFLYGEALNRSFYKTAQEMRGLVEPNEDYRHYKYKQLMRKKFEHEMRTGKF